MADYSGYTIPARNGTLSFASALSEGVAAGMQSYQQQKYQQAQLQMRQQQIQSENQLRQMQMQKLQQDMAPVTFDAAKFHLMQQASDSGYDIPNSMMKDQLQKIFDGLDSQPKLQMAQQFLTKKASSSTEQMDPASFSKMYGNQANFQQQFGSDAVPMQPQTAQVQGVPQQNPTRPPSFGDMNISASPQPAPAQPSGTVSMTPNEAKFYGEMAKNSTNAKLGEMTMAGRQDASYAQLIGSLQKNATTLQNTADVTARQKAIQDMKDQIAQYEANLKAKTSEDVANTRAKATTGAASIRAGAKGGASKNPDLGLVDSMIKDNGKAIDSSYKPVTGLSMELPQDATARRQAIASRGQQLMQLRALVATGMPLAKAAQTLQMQVPTQGAPSAKAAPPAPQSGGSPVIQQGNPRPKFQPGPGTSAQIAKLPDGQEFEVNGQVFLKQGNQAIPR